MDEQIHAEDTIMVYKEQLKAGLYESDRVQLCVLVEGYNQSDYIKLTRELRAGHYVGPLMVLSIETFGEWVELYKSASKGQAEKVVGQAVPF